MNTCSVDNCAKPVKRNTYCYGHYMKNWRYGTPTPEWPSKYDNLVLRRYGTLVVLARRGESWLCKCDCGKYRVTRTGDLNRTGAANTCGIAGQHLADAPSYAAAHARVKALYGPASSHECVGCGNPAKHWYYDHTDPNELHESGLSSNPIAYSAHPSHYSPRCVPCHKRYDLDRVDSMAHDLSAR